MSMGRFDGRIALITGAARGIGYAIAQRFAQEGARVAVVDLDPSRAPTTRAPATSASAAT
jgi:3-oxoacyl-[acyl-carrier protein] reductase